MPEEFDTYLLALEVAPMEVGKDYVQLPMHCTIMHRFHSSLSIGALTAALRPIIEATPAIDLMPVDHKAFGPKKQLVTIVESTAELTQLHQQLFEKLNSLGVQYTESDWVGDGYIPHVTDKQGKRLPADRPTLSSALYIISIEHPLKGTKRSVETAIRLLPKS